MATPRVKGASATGDAVKDVARLNEKVKDIIAKKVAHSKATGQPLPLDVQLAMRPSHPLKTGFPVYRERSELLVLGYCVVGVFFLLINSVQLGLVKTLLLGTSMFIAYDFYSGLLHVVLDNPANLHLPLIGQPCLEFQWHHYIPSDITSKSLLQACGDLNVVVFILFLIHVGWSSSLATEPYAIVLGFSKMFAAFFGQYSHRSAHNPWACKADPLVRFLQGSGLMISAKDHKIHHTAPHEYDYCLIGWWNPVFDFLCHRVVTNPTIARYLWLSVFLVWTIVDVKVMTFLWRLVLD